MVCIMGYRAGILEEHQVSAIAGALRRQAVPLKWLWRRLKELSAMQRLTREALLMKLGAAQNKAPAAWRLVTVEMAVQGATFGYWLSRKKLREVRRRECRYLLRTNLTESDPSKLWSITCNWSRSKKHSKRSRVICRSGRSTISGWRQLFLPPHCLT
jgi:hypothetical protein